MSIWERNTEPKGDSEKPIIVAEVSDYAYAYLRAWSEENCIPEDKALDQILSSVRRDSE